MVLPERPPGRERWLTRSEAARLLLAAWRFRENQKGKATDRRTRRHVARFILVALYTGTRAGAVCAAALEPTEGRGWIDLERGIFYRRPQGERKTKKRRPPVPLPNRLLAHLRRWHRLGQRSPVEWNRRPVKDVDKAFRNVANAAGLADVTPHILRHTAATWLMQLGTDKWEAAEYLGMTADQLDKTYGHHHPDHLRGPRESFDRPPQLRHRKPATEREQTSSNVTKIAESFTLVNARPDVRDVGVAGSNPATPTRIFQTISGARNSGTETSRSHRDRNRDRNVTPPARGDREAATTSRALQNRFHKWRLRANGAASAHQRCLHSG